MTAYSMIASLVNVLGETPALLASCLAHAGHEEWPRMTNVQTIAAVGLCVVIWLALRLGIVRRHLAQHGADAALPPRAFSWMRRPALNPATRWVLGAAALGLIALFFVSRAT